MQGGAAPEAGNYKGVMLCNRPTELSGPGQQHLTPQIDAPSFRPVGLPAEPLGLNPAKENMISNVVAVHEEAARRRHTMPHPAGPPNVLNKHRAWLAEMARKKADLNSELQASAQAAEAKRTKFVAYTKSMRAAVRKRAAETGHTSTLPFDKKKSVEAKVAEEEPKEEPKEEKPKAASKADASKPRWALTEEKAEAVEDDEANELVDFANNLDYDAYIDDLEVRQALSVIRERIDTEKAMAEVAQAAEQAEQAVEEAGGDWRDAFLSSWNGDDGASERGSVRSSVARRAPAEAGETAAQPEWDSSTVAGDTKKSVASEDARQMADELLKSNPALAAKHSVRSLASIVEKTNPQDDPAATANLPPLKIVTIIENPRVQEKKVDPSNLPYLHRNPAI